MFEQRDTNISDRESAHAEDGFSDDVVRTVFGGADERRVFTQQSAGQL